MPIPAIIDLSLLHAFLGEKPRKDAPSRSQQNVALLLGAQHPLPVKILCKIRSEVFPMRSALSFLFICLFLICTENLCFAGETDTTTIYFKNGRKLICDYAWVEGDTVILVVRGKQVAVGYDKSRIDMARSFPFVKFENVLTREVPGHDNEVRGDKGPETRDKDYEEAMMDYQRRLEAYEKERREIEAYNARVREYNARAKAFNARLRKERSERSPKAD